MTTALKLRKGTTAEHTSFTGALAEVTVDTDKKTLVVHDGVTPGGTPVAREDSLTKYLRHDTAEQNLNPTKKSNVRTNIGLDNIDNTRDVDKPISTATQEALDNKLSHSGGTLTGPLYLSGNAVGNLEVPTKQQVDTAINTAVSAIFVPYAGGKGQIFTSTGTFTVPEGVTAVKVRGCGGGAGSGISSGSGGTTSFGAYCSATGGGGNGSSGTGSTAGTGTGGNINLSGGRGGNAGAAGTYASGGAVGGGNGAGAATSEYNNAAPTGLLGGRGGLSNATGPTGYGNSAGSTGGVSPGQGVYAGGYFEKYITGLTPGATINVTIGAAGAAGTSGSAGAPGICIVEW